MKKYLLYLLGFVFVVTIGFLSLRPGSKSHVGPVDQSLSYEARLEQYNLASRMKNYGVPGISFAVIKDGKLDWAKGYGLLQKGGKDTVDQQTMFSVGSVSKVGTAVLVLKMQELGLVDVDEDVNKYLTSWQIPESHFTNDQAVTLRHILSHTAGLTVHGFADFYPGEKLTSTVQILKGESPAKNDPVYVNRPVGGQFRYSGGGTTVAQMLVEDVSRLLFHEAADSFVFQQLNMERSTYQNPLPANTTNIAKAHNRRGSTVALPQGYQSMPEAAASGLWTTPSDFSLLMIMLMEAYEGKNGFLTKATVDDMMTAVTPSDYGIGPGLSREGDEIRFSHGGANDSYRARFVGKLPSKTGIIIFTNGTAGSDLIEELLPVFGF